MLPKMQEKRALAQNKSGRIEIHLGILAQTHTETQVHRCSGCSCRYAVYKHTKPYNCFLLHTHTQPLNTHSQKHNKIHFMLINVAVHTHTHTHSTHLHYGYWHKATWSIVCCLDERAFNRKVSFFVEGHGNVNAPQQAKGSQSPRVF